MEFPDLGKHCSEPQCRRLDFLPVKCDGCNKVFCSDHYSYQGHNCPSAYKKDVQVPVCPLCNALIPGKADELPDIRVSRHIDSDCSSDTAVSRRKKVFTNRCSLKGCKQKELVKISCDRCHQNFCLKHRHPQDHSCTNASDKPVSKAGLAALSRFGGNQNSAAGRTTTSTSNTSRTVPASSTGGARGFLSTLTGSRSSNPPTRNISSLQGNISEEDALRLALEASMSGQGASNSNATPNAVALSQEQEDFLLAKALAESEMAAAGGETSSSSRRNQQNCDIC